MRTLASVPPELVTRATKGDREAQRELLEAIYSFVRRLLYRLVGPVSDLEDLEQSTLTKISMKLSTYDQKHPLQAWVARICVNTVRDEHRRRGARTRLAQQYAPVTDEVAAGLAEGLESREELNRVYRALEKLSPDQRAVLMLQRMYGHSIDEIADIMGAVSSTTRLRLFYAKRNFAKALEDPDEA